MVEIENNIIKRAARGDTDSFEVIYRKFSRFVYHVAYRMVDDSLDAEEIVQDVFMRVFDQLKHFRFESSLKTWVYRVTVNMTLNFRKKRSRQRTDAVTYQENIQMETKIVKPSWGDREEAQNRINRLLDVLNIDQRACIVLRNMEGLSYEEIAQTLNININTVRTRLKRAREKMLSLKEEVMKNEIS